MNKHRYLSKRIKSLRPEQKDAFIEMQKTPLLQLCYPCGFGKGYIIGTDLLDRVIGNNGNVHALCSHRLGLNDQHISEIFKLFLPLLGEVAFAFIGTTGGLNMTEIDEDNNYLLSRAILKYNENNPDTQIRGADTLTVTTTSVEELVAFIQRHHNRKVIIVSTYHSSHVLSDHRITLNTLYCDEAHELASDFEDAHRRDGFISNYLKINAARKFFFSATPKDCSDDAFKFNSFLMNNIKIFGKRLEMSHLEAINKGYVLSLVIDRLAPTNFNHYTQEFGSIRNKARLITEGQDQDRRRIREWSARPDMIGSKLLVRCNSVEKDMWPIYSVLKNRQENVLIFASASKDAAGSNARCNVIWYNGQEVEYNKITKTYIPCNRTISRKEYIESLQALNDTDEAIILHHDTISEGLNVPGFTSFLPLTDKLITTSKLIQNLGRVIRLNLIDKKRFLSGELQVDGEGWIKPRALMLLPCWSGISSSAVKSMFKVVHDLETNMGAKIGTEIPFGDDIATGYNKNREGSKRKKVDNRQENIEGTVFDTLYERYRVDNTIANENVRGANFDLGEGLRNLNDFILNGKNI